MTGGAAGIRRQIAELRMLVAQARRTHRRDHQSGRGFRRLGRAGERPRPRSLAARRASEQRCPPRSSGLPAKRQVDHRRAQGEQLVRQGGMAIIVSPSLRQSSLLFRKLHQLLVTGGESVPARDGDRTRDSRRRCRALPAGRPARHAARLEPALADDLAADRRRGGAGARVDVVGDLTDARRGTDSPPGALEHASRCFRRVSSCDGQAAKLIGGGSSSGRRIAAASRRPSSPASASGSAMRCFGKSITASSSPRLARYFPPKS